MTSLANAISLKNLAMIAGRFPAHTPKPKPANFDYSPITRGIIGVAGLLMSAACFYAVMRFATGFASAHPDTRNIAVVLHVLTVIPAVPLGAYLMLSRKGTKRHKQLGKLWVALMVITAIAITFIRGGTDFSFIHIFVPITLHGAWKTVATARRGDIAAHKRHLLSMYLGALMIPGVVSMAMPGRMMNVWMFG